MGSTTDSTERPAGSPLLEMRGITKEFPGVRALDSVELSLSRGEILGLVGENGAGKSTLMKILSGVYPEGSFAGEMRLHGQPLRFHGTAEAEAVGIAIIHQELSLFPNLTVLENLFVGRWPKGALGQIDWALMERDAREILRRVGASFSPLALVRDLSVGDGQMVEVARALMKKASILILDEPTSALSEKEIERLFTFLLERKSTGAPCIYISHKLDEVYRICDRVVVLRDGRTVGEGTLPALAREDLIAMMVGRRMENLYPRGSQSRGREPTLVCADVAARRRDTGKTVVSGVGFEAYPGEILGIGGMMGSGRTELFYALFGHPDFEASGEVRVGGKCVPRNSVRASVAHRVGLVTEDRAQTGLHLGLTIRENVSLASLRAISRGGFIRGPLERRRTAEYMSLLRIKAPHPDVLVGNLSGGNQQKVALAKWTAVEPLVLLLDEPTRGVDVGAKFEIYGLLADIAARGMAVVLVSSEIPELLGVCSRVLVMREGRLAGELRNGAMTPENIVRLAVGERSGEGEG